jgi:hypothetical protein
MKPRNINGTEADALTISDKTRTATKADGTVLRIVDALFDMPVQPTNDEVEKGTPGSKTHCAYCLACARMFGSVFVWIAKRIAYVEMNTGTDAEPELVRFIISKPGRKNARDFDLRALDRLQTMSKRTILFLAPKPYQRLDADWRKRGNAKLAARRAAQQNLPPAQLQAVRAAEQAEQKLRTTQRRAIQAQKAQKAAATSKQAAAASKAKKSDIDPDWWRRDGTGAGPAHLHASTA